MIRPAPPHAPHLCANEHVPGHRTRGPGHIHPAQQVQGTRHSPAPGRVPRLWTAPTQNTNTNTSQETNGRRRQTGEKGPANALWPTTLSSPQPTYERTSVRSVTSSLRSKASTSSPPPYTSLPPTNTTGTPQPSLRCPHHGKAPTIPSPPFTSISSYAPGPPHTSIAPG